MISSRRPPAAAPAAVAGQGRAFRHAWPLSAASLTLALVITTAFAVQGPATEPPLPKGFVDVRELIPGIHADLRYCTQLNFVGQKIDGYIAPRLILTKEAAEALARVQAELAPFGLGLKVFDAYRPQRSVDHFVRWAHDQGDTESKPLYYPNIPTKRQLTPQYIAGHSSHSRGSAVDLTIASLSEGKNLDMGCDFDFFDPAAWTEDKTIPPAARAHRMLLRNLMEKHGFKPYAREWWHFTLREEPFPETYFDFPVR